MSKTLGQVAYEAWHQSMYPDGGVPKPKWSPGREAWQAAADAVAARCVGDWAEIVNGMVELKHGKGRAVIEAARAWKKEGGGQSRVPSAAEARLWETLQALDSEEE